MLSKLWSFMSGKKTVAAAVIMIIATVIKDLATAGIVSPETVEPLINILSNIGMILGGLGVAHKVAKL